MAHRIAVIERHLNPPNEPRVPWELRTAGRLLTLAGPSVAFLAGKFREWAMEQGINLTQNAYKRFLQSRKGKQALRGYKSKKKIFSKYNRMPYKKKYNKKRSSSKKYSQQKGGQKVSSGKRTYRKRRPKVSLTKEVRLLKKEVHSGMATHTHKRFDTYRQIANTAQCSHTAYDINTASLIEAYTSNMRFFNPSTPATPTLANPSTSTDSMDIVFKSIYTKLELRNNYQVPCKVKVYVCRVKGDTAISPTTYFDNGIDDQVEGTASSTDPLIYLTDIDVLKAQYDIELIKDVELDAGNSCSAIYVVRQFDYDPSTYDAHSLAYQRKWRGCAFVVRVEGVLGHDTAVAGEQTTLQCGVDIAHTIKAVISYDAGASYNTIVIDDNRDASFTNSGVVSSKPVSDNITYSAA